MKSTKSHNGHCQKEQLEYGESSELQKVGSAIAYERVAAANYPAGES